MTSKSASKRRSSAPKNTPQSTTRYDEDDDALEDALAYEHGFYSGEDDETGMMSRASARVRRLTREREGRVVVAALAGGFAIGVLIGGVIASFREREKSWTDRLACEGLGRRLLDRIGSVIPESITERFSN